MSNKTMKIDLKHFKRKESKVFTGRPEGQKVRKDLKLDEIDKNDIVVNILIPNDTLSVNSSFFSGMFQKSLSTLGETQFRKKYQFICRKEVIIKINIEQNIKNCLLMLEKVEG